MGRVKAKAMAAAEQRDPYAHLEDNDAPPPTAEELAAVKDAIESGTAVLNMSPSKKKPNITMEELVGLPKGSQIPKGTMDAINQAWQRGNYVRSSTKKVTGISGEQFYAATGNDYRGDFRSVDSIYIHEDEQGEPTLVSRIVMAGPDKPPEGMDQAEFKIL